MAWDCFRDVFTGGRRFRSVRFNHACRSSLMLLEGNFMKKLKILYHQLMKKFHFYITQDLDAWDKHWEARKRLLEGSK